MKAAFALLADDQTHNAVRKLVWQMFEQHGISLATSRLPCHVSLKQPFDIANVEILEDYMAELAGSLAPVDVTLTELQLIEVAGADVPSGILWLKAEKTPELCRLHARLNDELAARFGSTEADFDGPGYQFHMTLSIGRPWAAYESAYREFKSAFTETRFQARAIALFAYDSKTECETEYISYRILPFGGAVGHQF